MLDNPDNVVELRTKMPFMASELLDFPFKDVTPESSILASREALNHVEDGVVLVENKCWRVGRPLRAAHVDGIGRHRELIGVDNVELRAISNL
jgi:hypothetical protein